MGLRQKFMSRGEVLDLLMEEGFDDEMDIIGPQEVDIDGENVEEAVDEAGGSGFYFQPAFLDDVELGSRDEEEEEATDSSRSTPSSFTAPNADFSFELDVDLDLDSEMDPNEAVDESDYMFEWTRDLSAFPLVPPFTGETGLQFEETEENTTPLALFSKFISLDTVKQFQSETNKYAQSIIREKERNNVPMSRRSIFKTWRTVTIDEVYKFLAILLHIGLVKKSTFKHYWSTDNCVKTTFAPMLMARTRFLSILSFFHLNDNATYIPRGQPNHDPLHKIRPFFNHLKQAFRSAYKPSQNICIDEALCPWRGRPQMRVCMRDKPVKWGIKLYQLCESKSGYVVEFEVMANEPNVSNTPLAVCQQLMGPYLNLGFCLFVDNYYCCPSL